MASYRYPSLDAHPPLVLLVPGHEIGPDHWMRAWERWGDDCRVLELGMWDEPHRNTWVNRLNIAIRRADRPVVLVVEDVAALALAWWAEYEQPTPEETPVLAAIVVRPPDVDRPGQDPRLAAFGAVPRTALPFPTWLVSSLDASHAEQRSSVRLGHDWGALAVSDDVRGEFRSGWMLLRAILRGNTAGHADPLAFPAIAARDAHFLAERRTG